MNTTIDNQYRGKLSISNRTISKIAGMVIQETQEVNALMEGKTKRKNRGDFYKAVGLKIQGAELSFHIFPVMLLGTPLHQICGRLQQNIKSSVELMTGLTVSEVRVTVSGVVGNQ